MVRATQVHSNRTCRPAVRRVLIRSEQARGPFTKAHVKTMLDARTVWRAEKPMMRQSFGHAASIMAMIPARSASGSVGQFCVKQRRLDR
jgi:hypothetical protein